MTLPKFKKDTIQKVVRLEKTITNRGGQIFYAGTMMVITELSKDKNTVRLRPIRGTIDVSCDGPFKFIGDKKDAGLARTQ